MLTQQTFFNHQIPWAYDGEQVTRMATASEAIAQAQLDWTVGKEPLEYRGERVKGMYLTVRQDTDTVLGQVGERYHPIQNREVFAFMDPVVAEKEGVFFTGAGSIDSGRLVWAQARVPGDFYVVQGDWVHQYLTFVWAHDGRRPLTISHTPRRAWCNNQLGYILSDLDNENHGSPTIYIKHTAGYKQQIRMAHYMVGLASKRTEVLAQLFSDLARTPMTPTPLKDFARAMFPSRPELEGGKASAYAQKVRDGLQEHFEMDINNQPGAQFSGWTAYNAMTGYVDHSMPTRKENRIQMAWFGRGNTLKQRALKWLVRHLLGVNME